MTTQTGVLADLRGVVRIARAATFGQAGAAPRIARAERAIATVAELIEAARQGARMTQAGVDRGLVFENPADCRRFFAALANLLGPQA